MIQNIISHHKYRYIIDGSVDKIELQKLKTDTFFLRDNSLKDD